MVGKLIMRSCGCCTLCCKLLPVPWMNSVEGENCQHCSPGVGCDIFNEAPSKCKEFNCLWKHADVMGEDLRPDKCGVVFEAYHIEKTVVAIVEQGSTWQEGEVKKLISQMLMDGYPVWVLEDKDRNLLFFRYRGS